LGLHPSFSALTDGGKRRYEVDTKSSSGASKRRIKVAKRVRKHVYSRGVSESRERMTTPPRKMSRIKDDVRTITARRVHRK
jgi:hypothetical protein